jgi:PAB-dependent poly(A)-specific ribonuclease subunit 3
MASNNTLPVPSTQYNPYLDDNSSVAGSASGYYPAQASYAATAQPVSPAFQAPSSMADFQKVQYHLYAPIGPHKEDLLPYQRHPHDFFMHEKLREDFQKKSEASLQIMPSRTLSSYS